MTPLGYANYYDRHAQFTLAISVLLYSLSSTRSMLYVSGSHWKEWAFQSLNATKARGTSCCKVTVYPWPPSLVLAFYQAYYTLESSAILTSLRKAHSYPIFFLVSASSFNLKDLINSSSIHEIIQNLCLDISITFPDLLLRSVNIFMQSSSGFILVFCSSNCVLFLIVKYDAQNRASSCVQLIIAISWHLLNVQQVQYWMGSLTHRSWVYGELISLFL